MSKVETLKDCCSFQEGYVNPSQKYREYFGGNIKWLRASDLNGFFVYDTEKTLSQKGFESAGASALMFKKDTLAISKSGTIGTLGILKDEMCGNRAVINIDVDKTKADLYYIFYLLKYKNKELVSKAHGSIQKNLYISVLEKTKLNHSDLSTQQKIAAVLTALDAKIELNARINAELESMAKTLYDYWFVQFKTPSLPPPNTTDDPPSYLGEVPAIAGGGGLVWNEALKREIPLGWEVAELGNFAQPIRGVTYKKDDIKKSSDKNAIPILRATNISNGVIDLNDMVYVPEEVVSEEQYLNKFDVLITMSSGSKAHVGKNAFYYFDQKVSFGAFCSKLSVNKNMRFYVNVQMQSDSFKKYIANVGLGTNINNLTNKHITEYKLLIPPKELLLEYENTVEGFYNRIGNNMKESQTLTELRDWLLPMLMNGQVQVQT